LAAFLEIIVQLITDLFSVIKKKNPPLEKAGFIVGLGGFEPSTPTLSR
jgi:hypothetical protein